MACLYYRKIKNKDLDMVVANDVGLPGFGMEEDMNRVTLILKSDQELASTISLGPSLKDSLGRQLVAAICSVMKPKSFDDQC